jgi:phosphatidylserine decarboxylase
MVSDAYRFLFPILLCAAAAAFFGFPTAALVLLIPAAFVAYFFRNPARVIPEGDGVVVSPADGKVVVVEKLSGTAPGAPDGHSISIFLNIFDVHVNRSPISGELAEFEYRRGAFKAAFDPVASEINEQNILTIRGSNMSVVVRQVAGLIARRVVCWKKPGEKMDRGELFGLIRFGSRVDILLPKEVELRVKVGDRVKGGSSVLGERL